MVVDGHIKYQFESKCGQKTATELLTRYPMLQVEIYNQGRTKTRTKVQAENSR